MTAADPGFARFLLWERSSRDTLEVKRAYVDMAGDLVAGIVLSQIVYWHLPARDGGSRLQVRRDGRLWLAKGRADWWAECRVSPKQADRALAILAARGLVEVRLFRFNGSPTKHVRIRPDGFLRAWEAGLARGAAEDESAAAGHPFSPVGGNPVSPTGEVQVARTGRSVTEIPTETPAPATARVVTDEGLVGELVAHGVGRAAARRLAGANPDACRRALAYLPYATVRTTPGAWLAAAVRDEYGPPAGFPKPAARPEVSTGDRPPTAARAANRGDRADARLRREYRRLVRGGGDRLAAFEAFVAAERDRVGRVAAHLSPARRAEQLAAFDRPGHRLALFARWRPVAASTGRSADPGARRRPAGERKRPDPIRAAVDGVEVVDGSEDDCAPGRVAGE